MRQFGSNHSHPIKNISTIREFHVTQDRWAFGAEILTFEHPGWIFFRRGKKIFECFAYHKSRRRAREIVEKLPWRAFNPSFWVECSYSEGVQRPIRLVPWNLRTEHYRSAFSLPEADGIPRYSSDTCVQAAVKSLQQRSRVSISEILRREAAVRKWRISFTDLCEIRDKNKFIPIFVSIEIIRISLCAFLYYASMKVTFLTLFDDISWISWHLKIEKLIFLYIHV